MALDEGLTQTSSIQNDLTSIERISKWLKSHVRDTESYISQDFINLYGPDAKMPVIPQVVTDYFNDAENRTSDPMALEKLAKARELTEATYEDQRQFVNKFIESQSRKLSIQYSVQLLKKTTTGINQVLSSN